MPRILPPSCVVAFGIAISLMLMPIGLSLALSAPGGELEAEPLQNTAKRLAQAPTTTVTPKANRAPAMLPNGATSINETFGDWSVNCNVAGGEKICALSQSQGDNQTGQRVFAIELRAPKNGATEGFALIPFGLKLADGIKLKIDEQNLGQGAQYSHCVPQGCLVPLSVPTVAMDAMKKGQKLVITGTRQGTNEPATFSASLTGFTAAINRVAQLAE